MRSLLFPLRHPGGGPSALCVAMVVLGALPTTDAYCAEIVTVKLEFGLKTQEPKQWRGGVQMRLAELLAVTPWSLEDADKDTLSADGTYSLTSRPGRAVSKTTEGSTDGFLLRVSGERGAAIELTANGQHVVVPLARLQLGAVSQLLGGDVTAQLLPGETALSTAERDDDYPALARDRTGRTWVAWLSYAEGGDVALTRTFDGTSWSDPRAVTAEPGDYHQPRIAAGRGSGVWAVWSANVEGRWDLFAAKHTGNRWGRPRRLTDSPGPDIYPRLIADRDGDLWLVWQSIEGGNSDVWLMRCRRGRWGGPTQVTTHPASDWQPAIAAAGGGSACIVWDTYRNGSYDVYARTFADGELSDPMPVAASENFEAHATVACDAAGRYWIGWDVGGPGWGKDYSEKSGFSFGAFGTLGPSHTYRRIGLACLAGAELQGLQHDIGAALPSVEWVQFKRDTDRGGPYYELPRLAVDGDGRLWLLYRVNFQGFHVHINAAWYTYAIFNDGNGWSKPMLLPRSGGRTEQQPSWCVAPDGTLVAAWAGDGRDFDWKQGHPTKRVKDGNVYVAQIPRPSLPASEIPLTAPLSPNVAMLPPDQPVLDERPAIAAGGQRYELFWGDFHRHTDISQCSSSVDGTRQDVYRYALDAGRLDFVAVTDHHTHSTPYSWWCTQKSADLFHADGRLIPFYAYERSMGNGLGHRNIIHLTRGHPMVLEPAEVQGANDTVRLWRTLAGRGDAISIPHQLSGPWHDWQYSNRELEPVVELFQGHRGSYEYAQSPRPRGLSPGRDRGSLWDALERNVRVGVIASSDHMSTHISYACAYATEMTREGIFDAIKARRTYAATEKMLLDFRIGDEHLMGATCPLRTPRNLTVDVTGMRKLTSVDIVRNNEIIYSHQPTTNSARFVHKDMAPPEGDCYYYVRAIQEDQNACWSSAVWLTETP
ncbi:MAG: hypothetical protein PVH68_04425 [Armatimonadota bacterium]